MTWASGDLGHTSSLGLWQHSTRILPYQPVSLVDIANQLQLSFP